MNRFPLETTSLAQTHAQFLAKLRTVLQPHRRLLTWLVVLLGIVFTLPQNVFSSVQTLDNKINFFDLSWQLEMPFRLSWNQWAGRDFVFTYGPLYQLTHSLGLLFSPQNVASLLRFHGALESILVMLLVWEALATTRTALKWRALSYGMWAILFAPYAGSAFGLKPIGFACLLALCGSFLAPENRSSTRRMAPVLWATTAPLGFLYAFDMGAVSLLALILLGVFAISSTRKRVSDDAIALRKQSGKLLFCTVGGMIFLWIALAISPGWNRYFSDSIEIARAYIVQFSLPLSSTHLLILLSVAAVSLALIFWALRHLRRALQSGEKADARFLALLGLACFTLVAIRTGLTRSNDWHLTCVVLPALFLVLPFGICLCHAAKKWFAPVLSTTIFVVLLFAQMGSEAVARRVAQVAHFDFGAAHLQIENDELRGALSALKTSRSPQIAVWPFHTLVNVIEKKRSPVLTLQFYMAETPQLEQRTIERLQRARDLPILFLRTPSGTIDKIENPTRNPLIFRYLLENYESKTRANNVAVLLTRRAKTRRWNPVFVSIPSATWQPKSQCVLSVPPNALRANDFLILRMKCAKTSLFPLGKPGRLTIEYSMSNGKSRTQTLLLPPDGKEHDVLFCATITTDAAFTDCFSPVGAPRSSVSIAKMSLHWQPLDVFSISPKQIEVERVFRLQPQG